jgi:hypothetical protein
MCYAACCDRTWPCLPPRLALVLYVPSLAAVFQFEVLGASRFALAAAIGLASAMLPALMTGMVRQKRPA